MGLAASAQTSATTDTRPATTTFFGDTGLWFVPTGESLPSGRWSTSGYRANFDREQGFTDLSHLAATFGVGVGRVEVFGSWRFDTRIDRDVRPLFTGDPDSGGLLNDYPFVTTEWNDDDVGDLLVGGKLNLLSQHRLQPVALAVRGILKLPTGDDLEGVSTGELDFLLDGIVSREFGESIEVAGFGGFTWRGDPEGINLSNGFRWGVGTGFPTRRSLRVTAELQGEYLFNDILENNTFLVAEDGSVAPFLSSLTNAVDANLGLTWQSAGGFFLGGGMSWAFPHDGRSEFGDFEDEPGDSLGFQFRLGYHPGVSVYVPPPPPPPARVIPPAPPAAPVNRPPTVQAQCNPCTIEVCRASTVTGLGQDPDGDPLTYRWSAPTGSFGNPFDRQTPWNAPCPGPPGPVPVTVTVDDGRGGSASDTVVIQVVQPIVKEVVFEDVHFDFDRYSLRPEAARQLDEAVKALADNPGMRLTIEGHTCNIGTAEYNLALGERRALSVRDYLASRGVQTGRLQTVSYGEERPKHDNSREETRRLNRRAALVVRVQ
jgi:outer membrane protein OmpA-like peptidoglycan-associated protein